MNQWFERIQGLEFAGQSPESLKPYALGALFALLLFYLLRFGRRKVVVTAGPIWAQVGSRRRFPLATLLSFLLQVVIFGALFSMLTDPREKASPTLRQVIAVVVDTSGSMAAKEGDKTRLDLAKVEARAVLEKINGNDLGLLLSAGEAPKVLAPFSNDGVALSSAVERASVSFGPSSIKAASALALQALQGVRGETVRRHLLLITDDPVAANALPLPEGIERIVIGVGTNTINAALLDVTVRPAPVLEGGYDLLVRVKSYTKIPLKGKIKLTTPTHSVGAIAIQLPALGEVVKEYQLTESAALTEGTALHATLEIEGDALSIDDQAFALLPATRRAKVILVTTGNRFLALALSLNPEVTLQTVSPEAYQNNASGSNTLVVFDRITPETLPPKAILIEPSGNLSPFRSKKRILNPRLTEWNTDSPILRGALAKDIHIEEASVFVPDRADSRLMGLPEGPVALLRESEGHFLLAFGFDFARSDLVLRIAFPVMLRNAFLRAMGWDEEGSKRVLDMVYRVGQPFVLEPNNQLLDDTAIPLPQSKLGGVDVCTPIKAGVYQLQSQGKSKNIVFNLGAYPASDISKTQPTQHKTALTELSRLLAHETQEPRRPYWVYLLLAAMAVALFDWVLYQWRLIY